MKKPLIIIGGPTACGKTSTAIHLAKKVGGEIISADSMQVYKYMDIGTAKPSKEEMDGIPHYLIDELCPNEEFNVVVFQQKAKKYMNEIWERGNIPILVGGTGFYINALVYNTDFTEMENDFSFRKGMYQLAEEKGAEVVYEKLKAVDPVYAASIHANNVKKVCRALEYYHLTGNRFSDHNKEQKQKISPYQVAFLVLNMERKRLYERIDLRVELMMKAGLLEEVTGLLEKGYTPDLVSMQGIGYKELIPHLKGDISLEDAVENLKKNTRHFAKRQITWFKGQTEGLWLDLSVAEEETVMKDMLDYLNRLEILGEVNHNGRLI